MSAAAACAAAREAVQDANEAGGDVDLSWLAPEARRNQWTLADDTLRFLARLVARLHPGHVVEFGSGASTRALGRAGTALDPVPTVVALENDPLFRRLTRQALEDDGTATAVDVQLTPVVVRHWHGHAVPVYHLTRSFLSRYGAPELVLVDGPPLPLGGREGSLLQAVHLAGPGTVVLLDDADRPSEKGALNRVDEVCGGHVERIELAGFAKGLVALLVTEAVDASAMPPPPVTEGSAS